MQTSVRRAQRRRDRERFVLSIHTIIVPKPDEVERAKSHDRWRKPNCTLVMQMAIIEVPDGIVELPSQVWQLNPCEFPKRKVRKGLRQV